MAKIIAVVNHKGGVAKTTSTSAIGSILAAGGKKVLMVDLDAQANLTRSHSSDDFDTKEAKTIYTALKDRDFLPIYDIKERTDEVLDLIPANSAMAQIEAVLATVPVGKDILLKKLLRTVDGKYDYILLDCPPSLGSVVTMALTAADGLVIPMTLDVLSYFGLELMMNTIRTVQENTNPELQILGLFFTKYDTRKSITHAVEINLLEELPQFDIHMFGKKIQLDTKIEAAPLAHKSLIAGAGITRAARDYYELTAEILDRIGDPEIKKWEMGTIEQIWPNNTL